MNHDSLVAQFHHDTGENQLPGVAINLLVIFNDFDEILTNQARSHSGYIFREMDLLHCICLRECLCEIVLSTVISVNIEVTRPSRKITEL